MQRTCNHAWYRISGVWAHLVKRQGTAASVAYHLMHRHLHGPWREDRRKRHTHKRTRAGTHTHTHAHEQALTHARVLTHTLTSTIIIQARESDDPETSGEEGRTAGNILTMHISTQQPAKPHAGAPWCRIPGEFSGYSVHPDIRREKTQAATDGTAGGIPPQLGKSQFSNTMKRFTDTGTVSLQVSISQTAQHKHCILSRNASQPMSTLRSTFRALKGPAFDQRHVLNYWIVEQLGGWEVAAIQEPRGEKRGSLVDSDSTAG